MAFLEMERLRRANGRVPMTEPETFPCRDCGAEVEVDPDAVGLVGDPVDCPNCGASVHVSVEWVNYAGAERCRGAA